MLTDNSLLVLWNLSAAGVHHACSCTILVGACLQIEAELKKWWAACPDDEREACEQLARQVRMQLALAGGQACM